MSALIFWDAAAPSGIELPVSRTIAAILEVPVDVQASGILLDGYDGARKQIDATAVLDTLEVSRHRSGINRPVLLVIGQDLFRAGSLFLFGLARPSTGVSVVSTARLSNEYYNRHPDTGDFVDRIAKEGSHEIGHLSGLDHCRDPGCIMFNPCTLEDLDRKKKQFCPACRRKLDAGIRK
jgi:archaemetzincin